MKFVKASVIFISAVFCGALRAQTEGAWYELLLAEFDDQPVDTAIGLGGAAQHQPVQISSQVSAIVRDAPVAGDQTLELTWDGPSPGATRLVRFHFLEDAEPVSGVMTISITVHPAVISNYLIRIRENGGGSLNFSNLAFVNTGLLVLSDAAGTPFNTLYAAGETLALRWEFDMDAGVYDFFIDDIEIESDRAHGIDLSGPGARGIGSVAFALGSASGDDAQLYVDDLRVEWLAPDDIFSDGFDPRMKRRPAL